MPQQFPEDIKKIQPNLAVDLPPQNVGGSITRVPSMMLDYSTGAAIGSREFEQDPEMQRLRALREQYAKGYSGEELGALRQQARGEIAGAQQAAQRQLRSGLGRAGVGGARAAAISGAGAQQGMKTAAEAERKMALDSAQMQRQGAADLQDFIFRQKIGKMGTAAGFMSIGSAERTGAQQAAANRGGGKK